jgi:hypothetical protein
VRFFPPYHCPVSLFSFIAGGSAGSNNIPSEDENKPFYTLGVNIGMQVLGGAVKNAVLPAELKYLVAGFSDMMMQKISDDQVKELLTKYGPKLNEIITKRSEDVLGQEKIKGQAFAKKYIEENSHAVELPSGLIYHERVPGLGKQV